MRRGEGWWVRGWEVLGKEEGRSSAGTDVDERQVRIHPARRGTEMALSEVGR